MRQFAQQSDHAESSFIEGARRGVYRPVEAQLLALQRSAGNRALNTELTRNPTRLMQFTGGPIAAVQRACCDSCGQGKSCEGADAGDSPPVTEVGGNTNEAM